MARFGRSQPHAPIYLRAPIVGFVVASVLAPQIHVIQAEPHRPPPGHVYVLRTPLAPPPTDQIHIVSLAPWRIQHPARDADVLYLRPAISSVVPDRLAPQVHVVSLVAQRGQLAGRKAGSLVQRTALTPPALTTQSAPQVHVVQPNRRARANPPTRVTVVRNALVPPALASGNAVQVHVVSPTWRVQHPARDADVTVVRPPVTSLVPDRLAPQFHVFLQHRRRPDPPAHVVLARNPAVVVPDRLPVQIHVLLQHRRRPDPPAHVTLERNALVPPPVPLVRAIAQAVGTLTVRPQTSATLVLTSPTIAEAPQVVTIRSVEGTSIMDTYTTATTDFDTSSTGINTSSAPMGGV